MVHFYRRKNLRSVVRSERSVFTTKLLVSEVGFWFSTSELFRAPFFEGNAWKLITDNKRWVCSFVVLDHKQ